MKKYYTTSKYKMRNKRRMIDRHKRKNRKGKSQDVVLFNREQLEIHKINEKLRINLQKINKTQVHVDLPEIFSITENYNEVIEKFEIIKKLIKDAKPLYLDMSKITKLTIETVLYFLSLFDSCKEIKLNYHIQGNAPENEECKQIFINSGFYEFVLSRYKNEKYEDKFLSIKFDNEISSETSKKLMIFIMRYLRKDRNQLKNLQKVLIEMMGNTVEHAYKESKRNDAKWYLIARYDEDQNHIKFSFLDNGIGIPSSINKVHSEKVKKLIDKINPFKKVLEDNYLIYSALKGEFRTKTQNKWRGNGLPRILETARNGYIDDLFIFSNNGLVKINDDNIIQQEIKSTFNGTLYSWIYI